MRPKWGRADRGSAKRLWTVRPSEIPAYVSRKRAAFELDMSPDTFDAYVSNGILPGPKRRGKLTRWKWAEIANVLDGGNLSVVQSEGDPYDQGVERAKAAANG